MRQLRATKMSPWPLILLFFSLSISPARSAEKVPSAPTETAAEAPKGETKGVPHISGGIGIEQQEAMRKQAGRYNLKLVFALKSREYVADVKVSIADKNGNEILNTISEGPWFYVQLPPEVYTIKCAFRGDTKEIRELRVPKSGQLTRTLLWDPQPKKSEKPTKGTES